MSPISSQMLSGRLPAMAVLFLLAAICGVSAQTYTLTNLGSLGGGTTEALSINDAGQATGSASVPVTLFPHGFLYSGGAMTDLGTYGGRFSFGTGINDSGQVTGYAYVTGDTAPHAFIYTNGAKTDIGTLGGDYSYGFAINSLGQVAGFSFTSGNASQQAFLYSNGTMTSLGTLGGANSAASGINNSGQVVGYSDTTGNTASHAFLYSGGVMTDLGTLGGTSSSANSINAAGQIVGYANTAADSQRAFLYSSGTMTNLGTLGGNASQAVGINSSGQIVGSSNITGNASSHGFLYSGGVMTDINSLVAGSGVTGLDISTAGTPINDFGQIVAKAMVGGIPTSFLLNPINPLTSTSSGGASRNTRFVGGMNYSKFTATANPGGGHSIFTILDGTVGSGGRETYGLNRYVTVTFTGVVDSHVASDVVNLNGTFEDAIVISLTYSEAAFGDNVALGWIDEGTGQWTLAVNGNTGGTPTYFNRAYNAATDFHLGYYGVDSATNTAWAVVDHNSTFAVIPEPTATALLPLALGMILFVRRRRMA